MTKSTLLRPLSRRWVRGPARLEGNDVVIDWQRGGSYDPLAEPRVGFELTRVTTPQDAVSFATRFGSLLWGLEGHDVVAPVPVRQPVTDFIREAEKLRSIVEAVLDVRRATQGDVAALARIRARFVVPQGKTSRTSSTATPKDWYPPDEQIADTDDRSLLIHVSHWASWQLSIGLKEARTFVYDRAERGESVPPGNLRVGIIPRSLLDVCYLTLAGALAEKEPIALCSECRRLFVVEDARQRFCTPRCANRARYRTFRLNHPDRVKKPGGKHAKTKRARRR